MNILTFDIEEWYLEKAYHGGRQERYSLFDNSLNFILDSLEKEDIKATFFCLGQMAVHFPEVIKKIASKGHEIGCHSNHHIWLNKLSREEVIEDTKEAIDALEQCFGNKIFGYRAPAFSIQQENQYIFEILSKCGIKYDASIFPASRAIGGFPTFPSDKPCIVHLGDVTIKEFPISISQIIFKNIAYSGGGYFRLLPYWLIKSRMSKSDYNMCYFHINDLLNEKKKIQSREQYENYYRSKGTLIERYKRYYKGNIGKHHIQEKYNQLLNDHQFISMKEAINILDWQQVPIVQL